MTPDAAAPLLTPAVRTEVLDEYRRLLEAGDLPDDATLDREYALFRERFGLAVLAGLDGEKLLTAMHDGGDTDSLVYWLEHKNDEEFSTLKFGSIRGGSALKFRLFKAAETGRWRAGVTSGNKPEDITLEEAVGYARQHRDQLLAGCEVLDGLPESGGDADYRRLEDRLIEVAPDVGRLAFGHKYFSLLFPTKLDDWHSPELQRLHLIRLGLKPPGPIDRERRYRCAGLILAAARELGLRVNHFAATMNRLRGGECGYWRIETGDGEGDEIYWPTMRDNRCVAIGWPELGNLSWVAPTKEARARLGQKFGQAYPNSPVAPRRARSQIVQFAARIAEGDVVLAVSGPKVFGTGRVTGEYRYRPDLDPSAPHHRPVEWLTIGQWTLPEPDEGLGTLVSRLDKQDENLLAIEHVLRTAEPLTNQPDSASTDRNATSRPVRLAANQQRIRSVLERKRQAILCGPPGTGKTFWAVRTARDLAAIGAFGQPFEGLTDQQRAAVTGAADAPGLVRQCCFHPGYGYEDFLEGYRPEAGDGGALSFALKDGLFKTLCRDAAGDRERDYYLVVDEINRGDVPRIFGELINALEADKRGEPVALAVSGEAFAVPENVFLIGTMNTADRSVSLLDAALRRRFGFIEMMPDPDALGEATVAGVPLGPWLAALNERVRVHVGRDARNLQVGHSYLMRRGAPLKDIAALRRAVRDDLVPLLQEYCYEDHAALAKVLGDQFVDVTNQRIKSTVFEPGADDALVAALLAPCPEITATAKAISADAAQPDEGDAEDDAEDEDGES